MYKHCDSYMHTCICESQEHKGTSRKTQLDGAQTALGRHWRTQKGNNSRQDGRYRFQASKRRRRRRGKRDGEVRQTQTNWWGGDVCLHFDQISIFHHVVWVTLQGREVAHTVIDWHTGWERNACKKGQPPTFNKTIIGIIIREERDIANFSGGLIKKICYFGPGRDKFIPD